MMRQVGWKPQPTGRLDLLDDYRKRRGLWADLAFSDPRVGDRFHEMYSYFIRVIAVNDNIVTTWDSTASIEFWTKTQWDQAFKYKTIPGRCIEIIDRGEA